MSYVIIKNEINKLIEKYIFVEKCKDKFLYFLDARNAKFGIWDKNKGVFYIHRQKFGDNFLCEEVHYDVDDHFGTAKPLIELNKCLLNKDQLLNFLYNLEIKYCDNNAIIKLLKTKELQ